MGIALSSQGELYILDGENNRVVKFDQRMKFERHFGGIEAGAGRLQKPLDILTGGRGEVFVLEPEAVVEFDYAGNYVRRIGEGVLKDARGFGIYGFGLVVADSAEVRFFDERGHVLKGIQGPLLMLEPGEELMDVGVREGKIFLLTTKRIQVFRFAEVVR